MGKGQARKIHRKESVKFMLIQQCLNWNKCLFQIVGALDTYHIFITNNF